MPALDLVSFSAALKEHYMPMRVEDMVYQDHPFMALVPKYKKFGGINLPIPIKYGNPQGRSSDFATAKTNKVAGRYERFVLTRDKDYSLADIDNETLEASMGDRNAFMEASTTEIDAALDSLSRSLATALYRTGSGSIGQIASGATVVGTAVVELEELEDITNFEVGQVIEVSTTDGGGALKTSPKTIIAVDRDNGTFTVDSNLDSVAGQEWATSDYLFVDGDYDAKIKGLGAWVPSTAPTATAFFGVDRTVDTRLGGLRLDVSDRPIEEGLIDGANRVAREGGRPDMAFQDFTDYGNLQKALGTKVRYVDLKANARIGFQGIMIDGPRGMINVIPDQDAVPGRTFMVQMDMFKLYSLNEPVRILNLDGLRVLRNSTEDSIEVRCGYYAQLGCNAPGWNINLQTR